MAFSVRISTLDRKENHYSNREVDELDEQKVNFKSQPNKEKSYLCILLYTTICQTIEIGRISKDLKGFERILLDFNGIVRHVDRFFGT